MDQQQIVQAAQEVITWLEILALVVQQAAYSVVQVRFALIVELERSLMEPVLAFPARIHA